MTGSEPRTIREGLCLARALSPFPLTSVTFVAGYGDGGVDIGKQHLVRLLRATAHIISSHVQSCRIIALGWSWSMQLLCIIFLNYK
jgi:hypothetical protein